MSVSSQMLRRASRITGVPVWLLAAVDRKEGSGTSPAGARGEFQLMPGTAAGLERKYHINTKTPWGNTLGGAYYLAEQYRSFKRWDYALAAYNAGPNAVRDYDGIPPYHETQDYVRSIMGKKPRGKSGGVSGTDLPGSFAPGLEPGGSTPGTPASLPSFTKEDAALEGLSALASGTYDPTKGLDALLAAAKSVAKASLQNQDQLQSFNQGFNSVPVIAQSKSSPRERKAASLVQHYLGTKYVWGGSQPGGFDCSGLLQFVWGQLGVKIPRTTYEQINAGRAVGKGSLRPGDAVFFGSKSNPHHVGMYIGGGRFVEAPHTGAVVRISKLQGRRDYVGARRFA